ncbi:hypothetical protein A9Q84_17330 [Halobacteriovorax marinus]|uniref:Uncharacterized protein n=1 Tax=Halobacteriovorax marinus TaxID=97084 RepID=A0A1Y5F409_9BACT|nr:hypothetical protein A9Q84_17330 [Halobacteriovorax marinus]
MEGRFRVEGIYDNRTLQRLQDLNLKDLSFDFRPRSFNFLQQHTFMELVENISTEDRLYLHFENEADFVVEKILTDLLISRSRDKVLLEFSDDQSVEYYEKFKSPFYWHYNSQSKNANLIAKSKYLKGMIIPFSELLKSFENNTLHNFTNNFHAQFFNVMEINKCELVLRMDWDSNLFSSIVEYFDFSLISIPINNKVEVCYRNVDLTKVQQHVSHLKALNL